MRASIVRFSRLVVLAASVALPALTRAGTAQRGGRIDPVPEAGEPGSLPRATSFDCQRRQRAATLAEIEQLRALADQRDAAALDRIGFWDTGDPAYRWNELAVAQLLAANTNNNLASRALALLNVAIYDATVTAWDSKYAYNRPRPSQVARSLSTGLPNPRSPAYPSEHAVVAGAASAVLTDRMQSACSRSRR